MARKREHNEPTLGEAWATLGQRLGLSVEERGERSIRALGTVRGRTITAEVDGGSARSEFGRFFFGLNTLSSRNRWEKWHTMLSVSCENPAGVTGTIESAVDVRDPAWKPGQYDPRNGRKVRTDPTSLAGHVLSVETHERLMSITDDVLIVVQPTAIRLEHRNTALPGHGATYVAGSIIHHYQGAPPPWPERALVGPVWWIDLLTDMADSLDR